jgi:hypothetical protein
VFLHRQLTTFSKHSLHALCAHRANENGDVLVVLIRAAVRLVSAVLQTKHLLTTVAIERQKVELMASLLAAMSP